MSDLKKTTQSLSATHPALAKQAVGWDPSEFVAGSGMKKRWKCELGHEWEAVIGNRALKKYGCPICSGQKILKGYNDLATLQPEIASQASGWDPSTIAQHSNLKLEWECQYGHIWKSTVTNRVRRGDGCPICSSHQTLPGFNDLATTDPEIAKKAYGWDPKTLTRKSNKKAGWICELGHTWVAAPQSLVSGSGCPVCAGKIVLFGFNDLQTLKPEVAAQALGWDPKNVTVSSQKILPWKCTAGHIWRTSVGNRTSGKSCPVCAGQRVLIGFNDLATTNPDVAVQADGWDPRTVTSGSTKKNTNRWKCELGHKWKATVALRTKGSGCPVCAGQRVWVGYNDLRTTHPDLARQANGWDPTSVMAGTDKNLDWKCDFGHEWKARGATRASGNNCPICSGQRVLVGFNDLATTHPRIASEAHNWNPQTLTAGSGLKRKFKCSEGHIWETAVGHRTGGKETGCPTCSKTGFDPNSEGYLYFLKHPDWEMLQIGITNVPDDRLSRHKRLGWELIELRGPMDGLIARAWETSILQMLKRHRAKLSPEEVAGKFDGYSEAWLTKSFPAESLNQLMEMVKDEE